MARAGTAIALLWAAAVLVVTAAGFWLWAIFRYSIDHMHPAEAAAITGLIALLLAGGVLWLAQRLSR